MATNTGKGFRKGAVTGKTQTYNPKNDHWVKRDTTTGQFVEVKTSNSEPFKGVTKEKQ